MEFSEAVNALLSTVENERVRKPSVAKKPAQKPADAPSGWTAGVVLEGNEGTVTTKPRTSPIESWSDELAAWGFDPSLYEVVEPVRVSTWQVLTKQDDEYVERQLWAYRARIKTKSGLSTTEIEELCKPIKRVKPVIHRPSGKYALVVPLGDWQIGKSDGDGLEGTVQRISEMIGKVINRVTYLRKAGYDIGHLVVTSLGDLGEGCVGHYEQQTFSVVLDRRDQNKVVRRLARNAIMAWAPLFGKVTVAAVAGNHGENRQNGKSFTSTNDNDDVAIWEQIAEALAVNPEAYGHIEWLLPTKELSVSLEVNGKVLGLAHGHQAKGTDIAKWWQGQALAGRPVAAADILLTGHFHHFRMAEVAKGRWWVQVPAMDGGSDWFEEMAGSGNSHGQVTFLLDENGWTEMVVL